MTGTVADVLRPALADLPDAPALVGPSGSLTYAELDAAADAAAGALWDLGVRPGDRVAACLPNDLDIVVAFHGAQRVGALWLGINEAYTEAEQEQLRALSTPRVVLGGPRCRLGGPSVVGVDRWARLVRAGSRAPAVDIDPHAPAAIAYTSGTTGLPKGIVHSQHNLLLPGAVLGATRGWGPDLRKGDSMPMTILNLLVLSTLTAAQARGCAVLIDRRDIDGIVEQLRAHDVNVWNGAPPQIYDLARRPELDLSALRELWSGGSDCPDELRQNVRDVHGLGIHSTYGLTEAPTVVAIDPVDGRTRTRASGVVLPHLELAACDADGVGQPSGSIGEFRVAAAGTGDWAHQWRPPLGQWRDGEMIAHQPPGAVVTGDVGTVDADGWVTVLDREKLVIVRGGANVYPAEVERVLRLHPGVAAVAVFGVPDDRLGERVAALVVTRGPVTGAELAALCRERLARYKVPEVWGRADGLSMNPMGKVNRQGLVDALSAAEPLGSS
ncbi:class I adenylate-forming enzyme family protein [Pseudofrankia inefficax]|uniref:AMP-dependent synthetase and ligase n=1 Tax=Pseudofrankia inefficax (strain DSM 45817 / CECT 9037 / DDB 130130 / EuI1c) TaxID=298654 RepID=E3IVB5_PSEI1|nr:AMP-binding protein [Pseudofrankia inefficax]ADP81279.1 AMP-dependent synthetase and ligase [Pseudofrankia inefficax]